MGVIIRDFFLICCSYNETLALYSKFRGRIIDTILFKDGLPSRWLFTSEKTGEIMKKKPEKLTSIFDIVQAFKNASRRLKGRKDHHVRSKIATVFYLESQYSMSNLLVDEGELLSLLQSKTCEVLAIQAFVGGCPLKGGGVFEHIITRHVGANYEQSARNQTFELLHPVENGELSTYNKDVERLLILETHHESLKVAAKRLIKHIEAVTETVISSLVLVMIFNSSWEPFVCCARTIGLGSVPPRYQYQRDRQALYFLDGISPEFPPPSYQSQLLNNLKPVSSCAIYSNGDIEKIIEAPPTAPTSHVSKFREKTPQLEDRAAPLGVQFGTGKR